MASKHKTCLYILLTMSTSFISPIKSGLAVDQIINTQDARYGDSCDFQAYRAFRVPMLDIMIQKFGEFEEQNVMMYKFENFTLNENGRQVKYDHVPPQYLDQICASSRNPLMCRQPEDGGNLGHCECLEMDVVEVLDTNATVVHQIRTRPFTYTFHYKHDIDASKTSVLPEDEEHDTTSEGSNTTAITNSTTTTVAPSRRKRDVTPDPPTNTTTKDDDSEEENVDIIGKQQRANGQMDLQISYTRCLARPYTFCGPPIITCQPYETHRHKLTTSCVYGRCRSNIILPSFILLTFTLFYPAVVKI